jgi:hypothetical protein
LTRIGVSKASNEKEVAGFSNPCRGTAPGLRNNPVVSVEITYLPDQHAWQIFHHPLNGMVASRTQQYGIEDWSDHYRVRWAGNLIEHRWTKEEPGLLRDGAQLQ